MVALVPQCHGADYPICRWPRPFKLFSPDLLVASCHGNLRPTGQFKYVFTHSRYPCACLSLYCSTALPIFTSRTSVFISSASFFRIFRAKDSQVDLVTPASSPSMLAVKSTRQLVAACFGTEPDTDLTSGHSHADLETDAEQADKPSRKKELV